MEQHVTVHDHEPLVQQRSCQPQRIQTVRLRESRVLDVGDAAAALQPHRLGLTPDHDRDVADAGGTQRIDLPLEQRAIAHANETLRFVARRSVQSRALAGCENDPYHTVTSLQSPVASHAAAGTRCLTRASSNAFVTYVRRSSLFTANARNVTA